MSTVNCEPAAGTSWLDEAIAIWHRTAPGLEIWSTVVWPHPDAITSRRAAAHRYLAMPGSDARTSPELTRISSLWFSQHDDCDALNGVPRAVLGEDGMGKDGVVGWSPVPKKTNGGEFPGTHRRDETF